jgi:hypothetical protein
MAETIIRELRRKQAVVYAGAMDAARAVSFNLSRRRQFERTIPAMRLLLFANQYQWKWPFDLPPD